MRGRVGVLLSLTFTLLVVPARAEPDEVHKLVARELMAKARTQREQGDLAAAYASFAKAHGIMHVPTTLLEVARASVDLGQLVQARRILAELAQMPAEPNEPAPFARARLDAAELLQRLAQGTPRLHVDLAGSPAPSATTLLVDGSVRPDCAAAPGCDLDPGTHLVAARTARAYAEEQVKLVVGETQQLELVFSPSRHLASSRPQALATTRTTRGTTSHVPTATWLLGSAGLAGIALGAYLGADAVATRNDLREACAPRCATSRVDDVRDQVVLANVSLGIGLASAAAAVATYVWAAPRSTESADSAPHLSLGAGPTASLQGGSLWAQGSF